MRVIRLSTFILATVCLCGAAQDESLLPQTSTETLPLEPLLRAEIVALPSVSAPPAPRRSAPAPGPAASINRNKSYCTVLSGVLEKNLELGPENSPVLISGSYVILEGATLRLRAGTMLHLAADPSLLPPAQSSTPDPSKNAVLTVWGSLICEGVTGNPVEFLNQETADAMFLLYGSRQSHFDGAKLKGIGIVQSGGLCLWTNCEFQKLPHYAVAAGGALFTHCTLRECGGIFATYNNGPWSLLVRRTIFERCREGIVLGSNPGQARLVIEQNHFIGTKGAHIRAMPVSKGKDLELLIGENWYGTALPEEIELRLVDRRADPSVRARLNTRPPADLPYSDSGCGVTAKVLAATAGTQQSMQQQIMRAHQPPPAATQASKIPAPAEAPAALSRAVSKSKSASK